VRDRLYRSRSDRILFGVAGGIADHLDVDPSLVRIVWVLLLFTGVGFFLYIAMAFFVPEEPWVAGPAAAEGAAATGAGAAGEGAATAPSAPSSWEAERAARRAARRAGRAERDGRGALILGALLILVGAWFFAKQFIPLLDEAQVWPVILIALGVLLLGGSVMRPRGGGQA